MLRLYSTTKIWNKMEPTAEQLQEIYRVCVRLTRQFRWYVRWVEQVPGGQVIVIGQAPDDSRRRIIVTIRHDGSTNYGTV
jgi:hypothetical protein